MRIMFQPDALHHQAPSNHTRHHHTLSGPPEKTSGFNIPNAPTASLHAARCTLHAARCTLHAQLTTTRPQLSVKLSLLPSRHDTASPPFPTQTPCPPFLSSPPPPADAPHLRSPSSPTPRHIRMPPALTHPPARHPIQRHDEYKPLPPHLPRYISPSHISPDHISPGHIHPGHIHPGHIHLGHIHLGHIHPAPPAKTIHGRIHAQSDIGLRPTRIQHFLHMLPTQPH